MSSLIGIPHLQTLCLDTFGTTHLSRTPVSICRHGTPSPDPRTQSAAGDTYPRMLTINIICVLCLFSFIMLIHIDLQHQLKDSCLVASDIQWRDRWLVVPPKMVTVHPRRRRT